jgi:hypothetical protein
MSQPFEMGWAVNRDEGAVRGKGGGDRNDLSFKARIIDSNGRSHQPVARFRVMHSCLVFEKLGVSFVEHLHIFSVGDDLVLLSGVP